MTQMGFFIDLSRCFGCNACAVACKQWHDVPPGPVKWLRIHQWESGTFPHVRYHILPLPCFHCARPVCVQACPHGALRKEGTYGAVLVDKEKCRGERRCFKACPYGAPQFEADLLARVKMSKCDMCHARLKQGLKPICVLSCSMRALEFGPLEELRARFGELDSAEGLPRGAITRPAVVFKETTPKRDILPWDPSRALALWRTRTDPQGRPLPDLFDCPEEVTQAPTGIVGRNRLKLKPTTVADLMVRTTDDE